MAQTAEASLHSLPPIDRAAVAAIRRQIRSTTYERLGFGPARVVRAKYRRSVTEDQARGVQQHPVEQHVSLEMLQRRVPPQLWGSIARQAAANHPEVEPAFIQDRVMKMQNVEIKNPPAPRAEGETVPMPRGKQIEATVRDGLRREFAAGRLPATDADLGARGAKWIIPQPRMDGSGSELGR